MAYSAPIPSSPPVASANYANSAGTASYANNAGTANSANNANYANTAGYANSSGLPAYSQWNNAIKVGTGYIYVYLESYTTGHNCDTNVNGLIYFNYYLGATRSSSGGCYGITYTLVNILANN